MHLHAERFKGKKNLLYTGVTRAMEQSAEIAGALRAVGAIPVIHPMIELAPIEGSKENAAVEAAIAALESVTGVERK